jgi:hypothetical protein
MAGPSSGSLGLAVVAARSFVSSIGRRPQHRANLSRYPLPPADHQRDPHRRRHLTDDRCDHIEHVFQAIWPFLWGLLAFLLLIMLMPEPHGLSYLLTLHAPDGARLVGFDKAHRTPARGSRFHAAPEASDHWHRTEDDPGRPHPFETAETLIDDPSMRWNEC